MGLYDSFPYTNFHELNLRWVLEELKKLKNKVDILDPEVIEKIKTLKERYNKTGSVFYMFPDLTTGGYSGNSSLIITPSKTLLMDCGPSTDWNAIRQYYDTLLANDIFTNIDYIVISHYHYDHIENLDNILSRYPHKDCKAFIALDPAGYYASTPTIEANYNYVVSTLTAHNVAFTEVNTVTEFTVDDNFTSMKLMNSTPSDYLYYSGIQTVYNDYSMVALFKCGNVYAMFPGDIQAEAQKRLYDLYTLPRLFLYAVHHHGIQNDDFRPYLEAIQPEYSIIMTSHNRALQSAASSFSGNYLAGDVGSTGFGSYEYVSGKDGGSIINGIAINKIGWYYSYIDLYVDNTYSGTVYNGEQNTPFTDINEALMFVQPNSNLHYRIHVVNTGTPYSYVWLRDISSAIEIICEAGTEIDGIYVRNCNSVFVGNATFNGAGRDINNNSTLAYVWSSSVVFNACSFDGTNLGNTGTPTALQIRETYDVYASTCSVSNVTRGVGTYRYGGISVNGNTWDTVNICYNLSSLALNIRGKDTITSVTSWITGSTSNGRPFTVSKDNLTATLLAKISSSAVSMPFYYNSTNPLCCVQGTSIYNILTGATVSI